MTEEELNEMIKRKNAEKLKSLEIAKNSSSWKVRILAIKLGYGIEDLKDDSDERVRAEIAKRGYFEEQYLNDPSPLVRNKAWKAKIFKEEIKFLRRENFG